MEIYFIFGFALLIFGIVSLFISGCCYWEWYCKKTNRFKEDEDE